MHSKNFRMRMRDRASLFAVRSWSPSRAFCSSSLLFLSYLLRLSSLSMSFLPTLAIALSLGSTKTLLSSCSNQLLCRCCSSSFLSLQQRSSICSLRSAFESTDSAFLSLHIQLLRSAPAKFKVHVNTHAQNVPLKISIRIDNKDSIIILSLLSMVYV